jgi:hypothetical protein
MVCTLHGTSGSDTEQGDRMTRQDATSPLGLSGSSGTTENKTRFWKMSTAANTRRGSILDLTESIS